jgi:threonine 3-dehydrogenase
MKALSKQYAKPGIWMIDAPAPTIGASDVLIKMRYSAICGSDVHIYNWDEWSQKNVPVPMITGHEFAGEICEIGSEVTHFKVGDIVSAEGHIACGHCVQCLTDQRHLCPNLLWTGVNHQGSFAEYLKYPASHVIKIPTDVPMEVAAVFDPLGNATHTALMFDCLGEDVLITGAGPIGIMAGMIAKTAGARRVIITDLNEERLQIARNMGLEAVHATKLDKNYTCQVAMEMSGSPKAMETILNQSQAGAKIALLGILPECAIDWSKVIFKGLTIQGIYGRKMYSTWHKMIRMVQAGLPVQKLITHQYPIDDYEAAFEMACSGVSGKVLLVW